MLAACGGGGGGGSSAPAPTPVQPAPVACQVRIVGDSQVETNTTGGATAQSCSGEPLRDVTWSVSGGSVQLSGTRSPTVAFSSSSTGTARLRVDAVLADGSAANATFDLTLQPISTSSQVTVQNDHAIRPDTDTSVRAIPLLANGDAVQNITWTQVEGPTVAMNTSEIGLLMFKAPASVSADTVLRFRATLTTQRGTTDSDDVRISIDRPLAAPHADAVFANAQRVVPYMAASQYAGVLQRCVYDTSLYYTSSQANNTCTAGTLPLLQQDAGAGGVPSVAQVMSRVLVSHDFLGANFEAFLNQDTHGDIRRMLAGVTAIVIGSHVRPSYYHPLTGAIYLDADFFWLTPAQRAVVTEVPDYRSSFDDALNFRVPWRTVRNNAYVTDAVPVGASHGRTMADAFIEVAPLMYHELTHAADFFPVANRQLNPALSIWDNLVIRLVEERTPSDLLAASYPLRSAEMKALGKVMFQGQTPTIQQRGYTPAQAAAYFAADVASNDYAYSIADTATISREDIAMLMEEFMMAYRHNVQYDIAFTNPLPAGGTGRDMIVAWGQRGRAGAATIKPRVKLAVSHITPWIASGAVDQLPAPLLMRTGVSWTDNLNLTGAVSASSALSGQSARVIVPDSAARARRDLEHRHH